MEAGNFTTLVFGNFDLGENSTCENSSVTVIINIFYLFLDIKSIFIRVKFDNLIYSGNNSQTCHLWSSFKIIFTLILSL